MIECQTDRDVLLRKNQDLMEQISDLKATSVALTVVPGAIKSGISSSSATSAAIRSTSIMATSAATVATTATSPTSATASKQRRKTVQLTATEKGKSDDLVIKDTSDEDNTGTATLKTRKEKRKFKRKYD
ncbi:unnamed protein product [Hermetia illucens]|uniref:Uncharacterized protein n=1 Tax=Hermetia illucens TaxID=343691 RepID=A0A7R8UP50_HERIL|nr:unnamed protein product [Hermetia illucens]